MFGQFGSYGTIRIIKSEIYKLLKLDPFDLSSVISPKKNGYYNSRPLY